jgi:hypothetical protein
VGALARRRGTALISLAAIAVAIPVSAYASPGPASSTSSGPGSEPLLQSVPRARCGPGSLPETGLQGRVSTVDVADGRAAKGYTCNTTTGAHFGTTGGYRVWRYVDSSGHTCAYYDTTLLFPTNALEGSTHRTGVFVLDMTDPAHPVQTDTLVTPAMQSPHESLNLNTQRGLLVADLGNPLSYPGVVDVYSVAQDCRHPVLDSSLPVGVLGHEGTFSPDGKTFWVSSAGGATLTAVDLSNPKMPVRLWTEHGLLVHGLNASNDGNTLYVADLGTGSPQVEVGLGKPTIPSSQTPGLTILDVSQIQHRVANPVVREISHLTWSTVSVPQVPLPVRINGHPYLVEQDEFATLKGQISADPAAQVGAARIIDIANPAHPKVISNIRLEVDMAKNRPAVKNDPGANSALQGYAGHYCSVPQRDNPGIVACSFIQSGLRIFDIRDPLHPREIAYFNAPVHPSVTGGLGSSYAMSAPTFDPQHRQIWYSDGNDGFYAVNVTNGVWPFKG